MSTRTAKSGGKQPPPPGKKAGGGKQAGGGKGRKPVAPVRVGKERNWGQIAMYSVVGLIAGGIILYAFLAALDSDRPWQEQAAEIEGIVEMRDKYPPGQEHQPGAVQYEESPPVGGPHNGTPQNCQGNVYEAPIPSEHAVHSMEHGAVWVTYSPELPADQVESLADRVDGIDFTLMSPYEGLDAPISVQAWGYQLKVDDASDDRIDEFVRVLRRNATLEPQVTSCEGSTATGSTPQDLGDQMGG